MTEQTMLKNLLDDAKDVEFWLGGKRDERNRRQWSWVWSGREFRVGDDNTFREEGKFNLFGDQICSFEIVKGL